MDIMRKLVAVLRSYREYYHDFRFFVKHSIVNKDSLQKLGYYPELGAIITGSPRKDLSDVMRYLK